jgi:hypothetical protein
MAPRGARRSVPCRAGARTHRERQLGFVVAVDVAGVADGIGYDVTVGTVDLAMPGRRRVHMLLVCADGDRGGVRGTRDAFGGALLASAPWQDIAQPACGSLFGGATSLSMLSMVPRHPHITTPSNAMTLISPR